MGEFRLELREDGQLQITIDSGADTAPVLDASAVSRLIEALGAIRAAMNPQVATECPARQKVEALLDPCWYVELELMQENPTLNIRDDRYGWLHYVIPKPEAKKLGEFLTQLASQSPAPPRGKAN